MQRVQILQVCEGVRSDLADGVPGKREVYETAHVSEVFVAQGGDEVIHQSQLGGLPVDIRWHKKQAGFGTQHGVGGRQVLAGTALGALHSTGRQEEQS